ncbi:putative ribonuclease H-like domain-containing protein [Tanacetum coccineum]
MSMKIYSKIKAKILEAQSEAFKDVNTPAEMLRGLYKHFERKEDGGLYFVEQIWVPAYGNLRTLVINKAHAIMYSLHPRADKMYYDLRDLYWWPRMKKDIALYTLLLWEVIENGATLLKTKIMEGVMTEMPITTAKEKAQRRLEVKARSTLMMGIPNEHQLKFKSIKDAKKLLEADFKSLLSPSPELLDEKISQKDVNKKLLRILSHEWNTHAVVLWNKADLDTMSMDDLYNNLKVYEPEFKGMSSSSSSTQNMAFMSSSNNNTSSTNGAVNTAQAVNTALGVSTASTQVNDAYYTNIDNLSDAIYCAFFASQPNSPQLIHEGLQQIHPDDMEEMDLKMEIGHVDSDQAEEWPNYALMAFSSLIPPPYIRNFMPPTPDLSFTGLDEFVNKPVVENCKAMSSEEEPKVVRKNDDAPCIEEWVLDGQEEDVSQPKIKKKIVRPGTQSNGFAGTKASDNADPKSSHDDGSKPSSDDGKKVDEDPRKDSECKDQEKEDNVNNTNNVNTVSSTVNAAGTNEVNVVGGKTSIELPFDLNMPALEDDSIFDFSRDDEDDGAVADMNNLDTTIQVSPNPTTRIHKDHPLDQVIGDLQSATQTRKMSKNLEEHGFVSTIQQRTNHKDLQNCLFACFLSQEEPKKVIHALKDPSWIEAMQEELLQFKLQEVWTLVDLPNGKRAIGSKWVFRNKKDEKGIMIRNKARLVAQGYT